MKKTYINPNINIVIIQASQILAGSPGYGETTTATSGNLSRESGGDFWDDEE